MLPTPSKLIGQLDAAAERPLFAYLRIGAGETMRLAADLAVEVTTSTDLADCKSLAYELSHVAAAAAEVHRAALADDGSYLAEQLACASWGGERLVPYLSRGLVDGVRHRDPVALSRLHSLMPAPQAPGELGRK